MTAAMEDRRNNREFRYLLYRIVRIAGRYFFIDVFMLFTVVVDYIKFRHDLFSSNNCRHHHDNLAILFVGIFNFYFAAQIAAASAMFREPAKHHAFITTAEFSVLRIVFIHFSPD
jgi:hypothetical protein